MSTEADIVVVGSMNVDMVVSSERMPEKGETIVGHDFQMISGGKGANQAVSCARLGAKVKMLGAVGSDPAGQMIVSALQAAGIDTGAIAELDGSSGTAAIFHTSNDNRIIVVPGANERYAPDRLGPFEEAIAKAKVLLVQLEINFDTMARAIEVAKANRVRVILNPAPARPLPPSVLEAVNYLTPNETEFALLTGSNIETEEELAERLRSFESAFPGKIIVTRGAKGCSYLSNGQLVTVTPPAVKVVDTTGAGDCFNGALAVQLSEGKPLAEAVEFAVKASALSVTVFGAQAAMPTREAVLSAEVVN